MLSSQGALKHNGDWSSESVYSTLLTVLSFMGQKDSRRIQLILCVPSYVQSRELLLQRQAPIIQDSSLHEELLLEVFHFIKQYFPIGENGKPLIKIESFGTSTPTIIKSEWINSVSRMFFHINDNIEGLKKEGVHALYLINSRDYDLLNFKEHVSFVNCIVY